MKKLIPLFILVAAFALPSIASADHGGCHGVGVGCVPDLFGGPTETTSGGGSTNGRPDTPAFDNSLAGAPDLSAPPAVDAPTGQSLQDRVTAADLATEFQCVSSNNESALEGALSRLGRRLGDSALDGIQSGLRGRGTAGRMLSDILGGDRIGDVLSGAGQDLATGLGDYASGWISDQLGDSCGDSSLGRRICQRVGNVIGDYVGDFISEQGGQLVGNVLSEIGLGEAGGAFGNAIGGAVGSIVGGLLGGGDDGVPIVVNREFVELTNARLSSVIGVTNSIYQLTDVELTRVCEVNPMIATLNNEVRAQVASRALEVGAEQLVQNPTQRLQDAGREGQIAHCENLRDTEAQRRCFDWILAQERGERINSCGSTNLVDRFWNQEACRSVAREYDRFQEARVDAQMSYIRSLDPALETEPLGFCGDGPNRGTTDRALCPPPYEWITTLPASDVTASRQEAENLQLNIDADAVGEAAGGLIADILEEITTVVEDEVESGLKRLVSGRDSSGRRSSSSYVDRLGGRSGNIGPSVGEGKNLFISNITNSLEMEAQFQELTTEVIAGFDGAITTFKELNACFLSHTGTPPEGVTRDQLLTAAGNASTTIQAILEPQFAFHQQALARSQSTVSSLGILLDQAQSAQGGDSLNLIAENYNAMRNAGLLFSTAELQFKAEELASLIASLGELQDNADAQLSACEALTEI